MSTSFSDVTSIRGFTGACLVDSESGLVLVSRGGTIDLEAMAAFSIQVVAVMLRNFKPLGLNDRIEEILITMGKKIHLIRSVEKAPGVLFCVCLDKNVARLGMARRQVRRIEERLVA